MEKFFKNLKKESDNYFLRNKDAFDDIDIDYQNIKELIESTKIKAKSILEIGCFDGRILDIYRKFLKPQKTYGVELSKKAILNAKKKYKGVKFFNLSSLEISKIKSKFDLVICGAFLYQLERKHIFNQFDSIYRILNNNGFLIIKDFDPLFKHTNSNRHNKKIKSYKTNYDNFLIESGLFDLIYKKKYFDNFKKDKINFKSNDFSITLYKKIDFIKSYPENVVK